VEALGVLAVAASTASAAVKAGAAERAATSDER